MALVATQAHGATIFRQVGELQGQGDGPGGGGGLPVGQHGGQGEHPDGDDLVVEGTHAPEGARASLESFGDHRMAMTLRLGRAFGRGLIRA